MSATQPSATAVRGGRARPWRPPPAAARELTRLAVASLTGAVTRGVQNALRRGAHGAPVTTDPARTVLLFFEDVERDRFVPNDRHLRRAARRAYHAVTVGRRASGFEVAFRNLCRALEQAGCRVVVNNAHLARRHPEHPVGLCGYPHVVDRWSLPNPVVLGPGMFDHPAQAPGLMRDARFRSYLVPCGWMQDLFTSYYGARCPIWFGGLEAESWPDLRDHPKDIDLLVYDKILWDRDDRAPTLLDPVLDEIARRGLRARVVRYGQYEHAEYLALLARARGLVFLCEHETQGFAYQEAMGRNVPVLAWDNGYWLDPVRTRYSAAPVPASSVPYFAPACGERFATPAEFPAALDRFLAGLPAYEPRRYVREQLSPERSARLYLEAYTAAARPRAAEPEAT